MVVKEAVLFENISLTRIIFFYYIIILFYDYFYQGKPSRFWINVEFKFPGKNWSEFIKSKDAENRDIEKQV